MKTPFRKALIAAAVLALSGTAVAQTIGHWKGKNMDHERLFWDNQDFMKQIGLVK